MNIDKITFRANVEYNKKIEQNLINESTNPLRLKANLSSLSALSNYNQVLVKPKFDKDSMDILTSIDELKKLIPDKLELPYSFELDAINGERIYDTEGKLCYIREYGNDIIRDYYPSENGLKVAKIFEINKNTGALISKIEPAIRQDGSLKTNITIFDEKINNKYTIIQLGEDSNINSITEFSGKGKDFRTLFKNPYNGTPIRYIEAKENNGGEFEFLDCRLDSNQNITEIKKLSTTRETNINYSGNKKIIDVKQRNIDY